MNRFVPKEKLSKQAQREENAKRRKTWDCCPVSRRIESKKIYNRKKKPHGRYDDGCMGLCV